MDVQNLQRDWWKSTFMTRAEPGASVILVMQRWHEEDLSGWLLENEPDRWMHIRLPMLAEDGDPMGREAGQPLCPERFSLEALREQRLSVGEEVWDAMYQQAPKAMRSGRIYDHFSIEHNQNSNITLRPDLPLQLAIDFNINPGMHIEVGQHDERIDALTCVHEIHGPRMNVEQAAEAVVQLIHDLGGWQWPELHIFGDRTGRDELTANSDTHYAIIERILRRGLGPGVFMRRRVPKKAPAIVDRVMAVNDALRDIDGRVHYFIHPRCERLIADFKTLRPGEDGLPDKSDRKISHASEADGYRIHYLRRIQSHIQRKPGRFSVTVHS